MHAAAISQQLNTDQAHDRRADRRRRTFLDAAVVLDNRMSTFDVLVRNRSGAGFLLKTENAALIPDEFALKLSDELGEYRCMVVRRGSNYLGVKIIDHKAPEKAKAKPVEKADPNADLRAQLAERFPHLAKATR
jgi:hypothetical protein